MGLQPFGDVIIRKLANVPIRCAGIVTYHFLSRLHLRACAVTLINNSVTRLPAPEFALGSRVLPIYHSAVGTKLCKFSQRCACFG